MPGVIYQTLYSGSGTVLQSPGEQNRGFGALFLHPGFLLFFTLNGFFLFISLPLPELYLLPQRCYVLPSLSGVEYVGVVS